MVRTRQAVRDRRRWQNGSLVRIRTQQPIHTVSGYERRSHRQRGFERRTLGARVIFGSGEHTNPTCARRGGRRRAGRSARSMHRRVLRVKTTTANSKLHVPPWRGFNLSWTPVRRNREVNPSRTMGNPAQTGRRPPCAPRDSPRTLRRGGRLFRRRPRAGTGGSLGARECTLHLHQRLLACGQPARCITGGRPRVFSPGQLPADVSHFGEPLTIRRTAVSTDPRLPCGKRELPAPRKAAICVAPRTSAGARRLLFTQPGPTGGQFGRTLHT